MMDKSTLMGDDEEGGAPICNPEQLFSKKDEVVDNLKQ